MIEHYRQPAGGERQRQRQILGYFRIFADLPLGLVLVKAILIHLSPYTH